jgi:hypothetical protein
MTSRKEISVGSKSIKKIYENQVLTMGLGSTLNLLPTSTTPLYHLYLSTICTSHHHHHPQTLRLNPPITQ